MRGVRRSERGRGATDKSGRPRADTRAQCVRRGRRVLRRVGGSPGIGLLARRSRGPTGLPIGSEGARVTMGPFLARGLARVVDGGRRSRGAAACTRGPRAMQQRQLGRRWLSIRHQLGCRPRSVHAPGACHGLGSFPTGQEIPCCCGCPRATSATRKPAPPACRAGPRAPARRRARPRPPAGDARRVAGPSDAVTRRAGAREHVDMTAAAPPTPLPRGEIFP